MAAARGGIVMSTPLDNQQLSLIPTPPPISASNIDRDTWLTEVCESFVHPSEANRQYYRLILEVLWPPEHGIPGPIVPMKRIREVIDAYRQTLDPAVETYKDPARRIRELQGEEGVVGIRKIGNGAGTKYQLAHLNFEPKRDPRSSLPVQVWERILNRYDHRCANCGRHESEIRLDADHKIPRLRAGGDDEGNWQPLCKECNNFKSTVCRGCVLDCRQCPWAFPETYAQIKMTEENIRRVRALATEQGVSPTEVLNTIIDRYFSNTAWD